MGKLNVEVLLYTDDAVLLSVDPTLLQGTSNTINNVAESIIFKVNVDKTKMMVSDAERATGNCGFSLDGQLIDQVNEFILLDECSEMMEYV